MRIDSGLAAPFVFLSPSLVSAPLCVFLPRVTSRHLYVVVVFHLLHDLTCAAVVFMHVGCVPCQMFFLNAAVSLCSQSSAYSALVLLAPPVFAGGSGFSHYVCSVWLTCCFLHHPFNSPLFSEAVARLPRPGCRRA